MTVIYKITSPSGRVYIGQARNFIKRRTAHRELKKQYKQPKLFRSYQKYGYEAHVFEIAHELPIDVSNEVLNQYEVLYMQLYRDCGIDLLNVKEGGCNGSHSEETRKKIGLRKIGNKNMLGKKHNEETREKIRKAVAGTIIDRAAKTKGTKRSDETKMKMSKARMGKVPWNKGKAGQYQIIVSEEMRQGVSERSKENWRKRKEAGISISVHGEEHPSSKLKEVDVIEIRRLASEGLSEYKLAAKFSVAHSLIHAIKKHKIWKHVP